jgi:hypothetical protein
MSTDARTIESVEPSPAAGLLGAARLLSWLVPTWAALLALSTVTHQPDPRTDFEAYARYVTTGHFLLSHLVGSIGGAALGTLGAAAVAVRLARGPSARRAVWGAGTLAVANVLATSVFGLAAFAQPAIGRAHLDGVGGAAGINDGVYSGPTFVMAGVATLALITGAIALGSAVSRTHPTLRRPGAALAAGLALFSPLGLFLAPAQPIAGAVAALAGGIAVVRLNRVGL